jgi:hypothetical protein
LEKLRLHLERLTAERQRHVQEIERLKAIIEELTRAA